MQIIKSVYRKVYFTMNEPPKMPFFNFCLFHFFKFPLTISKLLWKNHPFFIGSSEVLLHHKCFHFFNNDTTTLFLKFAWKCVFFVYFLFNKRNLNLLWRYMQKVFLCILPIWIKLRTVQYAISFSIIFILFHYY